MLVSTKWIRPLRGHFLHSPAIITFLISLTCWLLTFAYCKGRYWREPHSAFFNSDHVYDLQYSAVRESQANAFIDVASLPETNLKKASANPEICAAFVTIKREGKNYFASAIGSILEGLSDKERENLFLYVLFANVVPSIHLSWNATWLNKAADVAESYQVNNESLTHIAELEAQRIWAEKGVFDYIYALTACLKTEALYIAMFEDDIIFAEGWMAKTRSALQEINNIVSNGRRAWKNWIYLRLFYSETYIQWSSDDFWYENIWLTLSLTAIAGWGLLVGIRWLAPNSRKYLDLYAMATICIITIPAFTVLFFMIGKLPIQGVAELNSGCCTQALVFPRDQVPGLIQFLREKKAGQTDLIIEEYAASTARPRLALGPQVVQHVGLVSSRGSRPTDTQSVWAFWFEENESRKLKLEHEKLLETT